MSQVSYSGFRHLISIMHGFSWIFENKILTNLLFANVIFRFIIDPVFVDSYDDASHKS